ncbi:helix-turn-helix domain-containing protein [Natrinema sp. H-ect1]|uniref:AlbA family DNA-binding domain-containing protein n=1 Tax=Natrinema sp. H-ect1 TaxID=3242700 RepID=UPI00359DF9A4
MEKSTFEEKVSTLSGDEHSWVDFKQDYYGGGIKYRKAEFIKDVAALANTLSGRDTHYIFIGIDDGGNIVGANEEEIENSEEGQKHILAYDESDLQQIIDTYLSPYPEPSLYTFEFEGDKAAALAIPRLEKGPCVTSKKIKDDESIYLRSGQIFIRKGSSNEMIDHEYLEKIINYRIDSEKEDILDSVHKAVELGPELIEKMSSAVEEGSVPIDHDDGASVGVEQQFTRQPPTTGDEELNQDISLWRVRDSYRLDRHPLWGYYTKAETLNLDREAVEFLTNSSLSYQLPGIYWLHTSGIGTILDILLNTKDTSHIRKVGAEILFARGQREGFEEFIENSDAISLHGYGPYEEYLQEIDSKRESKLDYVIESESYNLSFGDVSERIDIKNIEKDEILAKIPVVAKGLQTAQQYVDDSGTRVHQRNKFKNCLHDLEFALGSVTTE